MTVHSAKGLEFGVVAVPHLVAQPAGRLLAAAAHARPRGGGAAGRACSCAGSARARSTSTSYAELCEEAKERDAEEGLRLFHVAATRARERLILSGVVKPQPGRDRNPGRR